MINRNAILEKTIIVYIFSISLILFIKPTFMFKRDGSLRKIGIRMDKDGDRETLFSFQIMSILLAIAIYVIMK